MKNKITVKELMDILKNYKEDDIVELWGSGGEGSGSCRDWEEASLFVADDEVMNYEN